MDQSKVKRLNYLRSMIAKYGHRWGEFPSQRLTGWVDEYNEIKENFPEEWVAYNKQYGSAASCSHDAYDLMA